MQPADTPDPELRSADVEDIPTLLPFIEGYYDFEGIPFNPGRVRDALKPLLGSDHFGRVWLIYVEDQPVGYAVLCFSYSIESGGVDSLVDELYVDPAWRGRGIGSRALAKVLDRARKLGVRRVYLEVARGNKKAQKLYQEAGFRARDKFFLMHMEFPEDD